MKKDNSTFDAKKDLRRKFIQDQQPAFILETHGGTGHLWQACYSHLPGIVFEIDEVKVEVLAKQRPEWIIYQADATTALLEGYTLDHTIEFIDIDPYGEPWPIIDALLFGKTKLHNTLTLVVNDGLRQKLQTGSGWNVKSLSPIINRYGSSTLCAQYLGIVQELLKAKVVEAGFALDHFEGYYTGHNGMMTHYAAVISRTGAAS